MPSLDGTRADISLPQVAAFLQIRHSDGFCECHISLSGLFGNAFAVLLEPPEPVAVANQSLCVVQVLSGFDGRGDSLPSMSF